MTETTRIQATIDTMTSALAAHDVDTILRTYEPGAVVVGTPEQPTSGAAALRALFEGFVATDPKLSFSGHSIIQAGDIALHLSPWSMTGTAPDGSAIRDGGLSVAVLRRQIDGRWLMVIDEPHGDGLMAR